MKLIYVASPYTSSDSKVMQERYQAVLAYCARMMVELREECVFFSPIVHHHPMALTYHLPVDFNFWADIDLTFLERCDELWVLKLVGWENSQGIVVEINFADENNKPVKYVEV